MCWGGGWFMYDSEEETFSLSMFMWKVSKKENHTVVYCVKYVTGIWINENRIHNYRTVIKFHFKALNHLS